MTPRSDKGIKPLSDSVRDMMRLDSKDLNPVEHELRAALAVIVNRYDDVYAPQIDGMESDIREILDKVEGSAKIMKKLADKVAKMPTNSYYQLHMKNTTKEIDRAIKAAIAEITFLRLLWYSLRNNKLNSIIIIGILMLVAPFIRIFLVSLLVFFIEKTIGINLIEQWPSLGHLIL